MATIRIGDYPQLTLLAWSAGSGGPDKMIEESAALAIYERNWRLLDEERLDDQEKDLIERLIREHGHGVLHV